MKSELEKFQESILQGIPDKLPRAKQYDEALNHAPKRKDILSRDEKILAVRNALRYFPQKFHKVLAKEFAEELEKYGRIYMYRFKPEYKIYARKIDDFPHKSIQAAAIMLMISNNLDDAIAQHPHELITYGGNGAVFQNWAQYLLTMKYLATMTDEQTLVMYSGHPLGLFPSHVDAPRVVVTNGMMVPNYSKDDDWEKYNALGVTQYGQMTAGSYMYIGPQGIVHGTTITILNAGRRLEKGIDNLAGKIFVSSGLGGMSGAQAKAAVIAGAVGVIAEVNPKAIEKRKNQGWLNEVHQDLNQLMERIRVAQKNREAVSLGYHGNIVDLWERLAKENIKVDLGSDQTSLHNPYGGGYYPVDLTFEESKEMISADPKRFKEYVHKSLIRQVAAINQMTDRGMYFWDYGNAFLLKAWEAGANVKKENGDFIYPSYVEHIMGPLYFDYGFGPFRWVCTSSDPMDLELTDKIATGVMKDLFTKSPKEIRKQIKDNIRWIQAAGENNLVVGSQARILYTNAEGRIQIAKAFNDAIRNKKISRPVVIGRDHHDVSSADSPYRETANIYDGSYKTADMAVQNVIGDSFRGATWVSIHNGGGVGWGEVINSGFGMVLDGSKNAERRLNSMIYWDVHNGLARRCWARNEGAMLSVKRALKENPDLKVTEPYRVDEDILSTLF